MTPPNSIGCSLAYPSGCNQIYRPGIVENTGFLWYHYTLRMIPSIINEWVKANAFEVLPRQKYAQMASAFQCVNVVTNDIPIVPSIESIKGLEAKRCLFVLTTDLAPYLFWEKRDDNKMSHLLYVALTRSSDHMTILVSKEVEGTYTKAVVESFFASNILKGGTLKA